MISRRTFIQQTSTLASAAILPAWPSQRRPYKMGLQLFTIRAAMAQDVPGTLKRIAAMGYEEVETYGFDPTALRYYGLDAAVFAQRLRENNIATPSGHYDLNRYMSTSVDDLKRYVDRCIAGAKVLGQSYITWPLLDPPDRSVELLAFQRRNQQSFHNCAGDLGSERSLRFPPSDESVFESYLDQRRLNAGGV